MDAGTPRRFPERLRKEHMSDALKRFVILVDDEGRDILRRAIELRNAMDGINEASSQAGDGEAIVAIVKAWREAETARIRAAKGA
jgi:hypothetical protein